MHMEDALETAQGITRKAFDDYDDHAVLWTGGKDSTALLQLVRETTGAAPTDPGVPIETVDDAPAFDVVFIDHGLHFEEVIEFRNAVVEAWELQDRFLEVANDALLQHVDRDAAIAGDDGRHKQSVPVEQLPEAQREEIAAVADSTGRDEPDAIPWSTNTFWGNHMLKSWPLKQIAQDYDAVWSGIRADEDDARSDETAFSDREDPEHTRIHPLIEFTEDQLWAYTKKAFVPYCELYDHGYTSLGAAPWTDPAPQNVQPMQAADMGERAGRAQRKDNMLEQLRQEGYM